LRLLQRPEGLICGTRADSSTNVEAMPSTQDLKKYLDEAQRLVAEYGKVRAAYSSYLQATACSAACRTIISIVGRTHDEGKI
jgi:hypothetical protein